MTLTYPGLPLEWVAAICLFMVSLTMWAVLVPGSGRVATFRLMMVRLPLLGPLLRFLTASPWPLLALKLVMVALFLLIIAAGLYGTPVAGRNLATVLTWNIWWTGLILSVFFLGSAWCAICPWDALASWLVRRRAHPDNSLNLRVPRLLRNVWPALLMLVVLTWLELGLGITINPYSTALLALAIVVMATLSLAIFEKKAFCRYFCPVGRTIGAYSQLAPVELRPIDTDICARCTTLECYHGNESIEPCPTHLVMGRLQQNSYCTSCGNCVQSCPHHNIAWRLRPPSLEAVHTARPHWDEAWFMLGLLALTGFHGLTMMPFFKEWVSALAYAIGDSGRLLWSFSILLLLGLALPVVIYTLLTGITSSLVAPRAGFKKLFSGLAFAALPLAFAYHLAHNLNHLVRESAGLGAIIADPLGAGARPLSLLEKHSRHMDLLISQDLLFALQAGLMMFGFWISLKVIQQRGNSLVIDAGWRLFPMVLFVMGVTLYHLWLLMQPMVMRM
ncbi:MAG: 4Fe-4S binding protein [Gammaproteobacteria bacterium]